MEKSTKLVPQLYGYAVCLVAVITFLFSFTAMVIAIVDVDEPLHAGWSFPLSPSLASYENYKMDVLKSSKGDVSTSSYLPDDQTLHTMFDAAKAERVLKVKHQARQSVIIGGLLIIVSVILFASHWMWMQKRIPLLSK